MLIRRRKRRLSDHVSHKHRYVSRNDRKCRHAGREASIAETHVVDEDENVDDVVDRRTTFEIARTPRSSYQKRRRRERKRERDGLVTRIISRRVHVSTIRAGRQTYRERWTKMVALKILPSTCPPPPLLPSTCSNREESIDVYRIFIKLLFIF